MTRQDGTGRGAMLLWEKNVVIYRCGDKMKWRRASCHKRHKQGEP